MGNLQTVLAGVDNKNAMQQKVPSSPEESEKYMIEVEDRFFLTALLSVGYTPYTAIPELVDNSLDAKATEIEMVYDYKSNTFSIKDNGLGMPYGKLQKSMNLGVDREYSTSDVGYFGVGMKSSILNLMNLDDTNSKVEIISTYQDRTTKVIWEPLKSARGYIITDLGDIGNPNGTTIVIYGSKKIQGAAVKRNFGVMYNPVLKTDTVTISINGENIEGNDPLYRDNDKVKLNFVDAKVKNQTIRIEAVGIGAIESNMHPWDTFKESGQSSRFAMNKGGIYVIYGGRYVELGGNLGILANHPKFNYVRVEFTLPKDLTETFNLKFNKTRGLELSPKDERNEPLSDLIQKLKMMLTWGEKIRLKTEEATESDKDELLLFKQEVNDAANRARLSGPDAPSIPRDPKSRIPKPKVDDPKPDDESKPEVDKTPRQPKIRRAEPYDFKYEDLGSASVFWHLEYINNQFVITLNNAHDFFKETWPNMNDSAKKSVLILLASLAYGQYEVTKTMDMQIDTSGNYSTIFWEQFWNTVSMRLRHLIIS